MGQVLAQQNRKLVDIFCRIHSPSEFKKVSIDGDVRLTRDKGGETDLSGISTGQRSALAVSIFLSMNSSVGMRAPWIIFDDPVAQVDDLNTLSFLDVFVGSSFLRGSDSCSSRPPTNGELGNSEV